MTAWYNEIEPYAAQWLRNLIEAGLLQAGEVDERSIVDVRPADLAGFDQCHFFAGIGGWPYALQLAGWGDRPVWTGSCPCQPFSVAGKGKAGDDERHLWPAWASLIAQCKPPIVFGEQVEAAIGWGWLDLVFADLEAAGYACGATVLPACGVGAPHIRQRLWFVADAEGDRSGTHRTFWQGALSERGGSPSGLADAGCERGAGRRDVRDVGGPPVGDEGASGQRQWVWNVADDGGSDGGLADAGSGGWRQQPAKLAAPGSGQGRHAHDGDRNSRLAGAWSHLEWLPCRDGKARPTQPGIFPLAHGVSARVGRLRAYGNAIVPQVAAEFVAAFMECRP